MKRERKKVPEIQRITKSQGRLMVGVAVFFDLFPVLLLILVTILSIYYIADITGAIDAISELDACTGALEWYEYNLLAIPWRLLLCARFTLTAGLMLFSSVSGVIYIFPLLYTIGSFVSTILGFIFFTFWFMFKRVYIWSFSKVDRVLINLISALIESIPILNLLPGITFMVWRHVKATQLEDKKKNIMSQKKQFKVMRGRKQRS